MDDLFFNDESRNRKKRPNGEIYEPSDLTNNNVYSDSVFSQGGEKKFRVNIPEENRNPHSANPTGDIRSRTPSGRPVESLSKNQPSNIPGSSRTPKGRPVYEGGGTYKSPSDTVKPGQTFGSYTADIPSFTGPLNDQDMPFQKNTAQSYPGRTPVRPDSSIRSKPPVRRQTSKSTASGTSAKNGTAKGRPAKTGKKKKGPKIAAAVFAVIAVLLAALFAYGYSILGKINYDTDSIKKNQYISEKELYSNPNIQNILLIGSDARSEIQGMRSDTMILFSVDKKNKQIKLTSFLRDSYVCIPSTGNWRKLNAACSAGGAQLVIDTIEYNFKVKIDSYVLVDFKVFTKLIDLMGGLTVKDVTAEEARYLREKVKIVYAKEGTNKFSGAAALWYCRIRYLDDDFHRTQRQRKVISAIINQAKSMNPLELVKIVEKVLPMITTDIGRNDMLSLGLNAVAKYSRYDIVQHQIPAKGTWSNVSVPGVGDALKMDIDENARLLKQFLASKQTEETTTKKK